MGHDWPTPPWVLTVGQGAVIAGLAVIVIASLRLGAGLTPTPVPNARGQLATGGLYRLMRHPIYTGVLLIVVGLTIRSGSYVTLAVADVAVFVFARRARWEEARLCERFDGYAAYASLAPRFVPGLSRRK